LIRYAKKERMAMRKRSFIGGKVFTTALVALLLFVWGQPISALALEPTVRADGDRLVYEYRFADEHDFPAIQDEVQIDNKGYSLVSTTDPVIDPDYTPASKVYTQSLTKDIPLEGINSLWNYFPDTYAFEDGSFAGAVPLTNYQTENVYELYTGQVDRAWTINGLPDNDVIRIPRSMDFTVRSDAYPGATQTKTLQLLDVRYEITGTTPLGLPNEYRAYVTYRGEEEWQQLHHYIVTAHYQGAITSSDTQFLVTASYEPKVVAEIATPPAPLAPEPAVAAPVTEKAAFSWAALIAALLAAVVALSAILFFIRRFRRFRIYYIDSAEDSESMVLVARLPIKGSKAGHTVFIPERYELTNLEGNHVGVLPKSYHGGPIAIWQGDYKLYEGEVLVQIPLFNDNAYKQAASRDVCPAVGA
jgi:hypothetical protein